MTVTNASGGLNPEYAVGDIVLLHDVCMNPCCQKEIDLMNQKHIFLAGLGGLHPLRGPNVDDFGIRFPSLSDAYDLELRRLVHKAWGKVIHPERKRRLHEGVYAFVSGPRLVILFSAPALLDIQVTNKLNPCKAMRQELNAVCYGHLVQIWLACRLYLKLLSRDTVECEY